ncbi:unnamed protein product, partial [Ceratitis capitata]
PLTAVTDIKPAQRPNHLELVPQTSVNMRKSPSLLTADEDKSPTTPSSPSHEINKLKDQLEQQAIQTRQALAQLMLVREQLISETNARIEAQARTQQLLQQNRELLEHLASLGAYNEQQTAGLTSANIGMAHSPYPTMNQLQSISTPFAAAECAYHATQQDALSKISTGQSGAFESATGAQSRRWQQHECAVVGRTPLGNAQQTPSPRNSFFFVNPMSCSPANNNMQRVTSTSLARQLRYQAN